MRWRAFVEEQRALFDVAELPGALADRPSFEYFLMHGWLADGSGFSLEALDEEQRGALRRLASAYVAEFGDPGLGPAIEPVA